MICGNYLEDMTVTEEIDQKHTAKGIWLEDTADKRRDLALEQTVRIELIKEEGE